MKNELVKNYIDQEFLSTEHDKFTVAMIKPDGVARGLMDEFEQELNVQQLLIDFCFSVSLKRETIYQAFRVLREPSKFTDNWQEDVAQALTVGPSIVYIISGNNAVDKVIQIKKAIRTKYLDRTQYVQRVLKNLIHSSDSTKEAQEELVALIGDIDYAQMLLATGLIKTEVKEKIFEKESTETMLMLVTDWVMTLAEIDEPTIGELAKSQWFLSYLYLLNNHSHL
ncbi:hypothetical protein COU89_00280 [Candidatus Roizmanbacteria bacterium CG10_big_fil_rev_8_21_14_0_10_45_7]|uniref:Nucleoside diphosphate kinase-like domain-containing protein n=1 Tax=Candidatus Roizmanbacteria bacterium CG10_big_fil_rev_8_21_14_0_10_45_7 TaxID=1974854 RepID=A0A2M8KVL3_9BACT|nr:MAG: hypothetical protein COU89_00280 [Candidatus Roizmanbacteria bacterium CG10_big_fil_rev_8_21_14_0_10_45_7]